MKCLRCGPLIKAIDAYLAKAENDLYEQLTMEGYLKAKESLNTVDEIEEVVTCLLYTSPSLRDVEESRMPSSA